MNILVIGAGSMGQAIAYDLSKFSNFDKITIIDKDKESIKKLKKIFHKDNLNFGLIDVESQNKLTNFFSKNDIIISAIPYIFNYELTKIAINNHSHFIDLGGNNSIVRKQKRLFKKACEKNIIVIPDCGLAPGLVSIVTKDIVENTDSVEYVKIRVGGLPINPKPPFNYQIVFSPNGLINEYAEDAILLSNGKIKKKKSLTEVETIKFPPPFEKLEAFVTSGGCSTLPYSYKNKIRYLDYKTIRYKGHCKLIKPLFDIGLASNKTIEIQGCKIKPREILTKLLLRNIPSEGGDVVLMKIISKAIKNNRLLDIEYSMIDYYDEKNNISAMMRTTGYPVSIIAQMIERGNIQDKGVYCCEEIVPCQLFFKEMSKRNIILNKIMR